MRILICLMLLLPGAMLAQDIAAVFGNGDQPPANSVAQGRTDFIALGFVVLHVSGTGSINLTSCTIANIASPNPAGAADTIRIRLIRDDDMNLTVSPGDTVLATVNNPTFPVTFSGFSSPVPSTSATSFPILMVAIDVAGGATPNNVYRLQLTAFSTNALINDGAPITGENQTIVAPSNADMEIRRLGVPIAVGDTDDVGGLQVNTPNIVTWTIHNSGTDPLSLTGSPRVFIPVASVSVVNCIVSVEVQPDSPIGMNGATTFSMRIEPTLLGQPFFFPIAINNNDPQDNPYTIMVSGVATAGPGPATQLVVTQQPGNGVAGMALAQQPIVEARDSSGALDTSFNGSVVANLAPAVGSPPPALIGNTAVNAVAGIATFTDLGVDQAGVDFRIVLTSGTLSAAVSANFTVTAAPATQLVVAQQPGPGPVGAPLTVQPIIEARSAGGALDTGFNAAVTASIASGPRGATLQGTTTINAVAGEAVFTNLGLSQPGMYTLSFASAGLASATSVSFNVSGGMAAQLFIALQPGNGTGGSLLTLQPVVEARDTGGQLAGSFTSNVTAAITAGTGTSGATLLGTLTVQAVAGVATFSDLAVDLAGSGYTLTFTAGMLTQAVSDPFDVDLGPAARLAILTQPGSAAPNQPLNPQPVVAITDLGGNTVVTDSSTNVSVMTASGPVNALLTGTIVVTASAGIVTWTDLGLDTPGTYTLEFFDGALASAISQPFGIAVVDPPRPSGSSGSSDGGCAIGGGAIGLLPALAALALARRRRRA